MFKNIIITLLSFSTIALLSIEINRGYQKWLESRPEYVTTESESFIKLREDVDYLMMRDYKQCPILPGLEEEIEDDSVQGVGQE